MLMKRSEDVYMDSVKIFYKLARPSIFSLTLQITRVTEICK